MTVSDDRGEVGRSRRRVEDARLVTGSTTWTDDVRRPDALHMVVVRSPMAHARIGSVDVTAALAAPGVVAALTGADLVEDIAPLPSISQVTPDMVRPEHRALAVTEVGHVGDGVAVVLAESAAAAVDAAEQVIVEYEPLAAITDLRAAAEDGAPTAHATLDSNICFETSGAAPDPDAVAAARDDADHVIELELDQRRLMPVAMEPRAATAEPTDDGGVTLWSATQVPHIVRALLADACDIDAAMLRVVAPDVGGGFGGKLDVYAEEALVVALARRTGRPVTWTATRSEDLQTTVHGRGQVQRIALALDDDGTFRALEVQLLADLGAHLQLLTAGIAPGGLKLYPGIYRIPAYSFGCTGVFTNATPTDAYRGAGRPEAAFAIERVVDEAAAVLGLDPLELRRRNWVGRDEFPHTSVTGVTFDTGDHDAAADRATELFDYDARRDERDRRRAQGDTRLLGIGVSTYTEECGLTIALDGVNGEHAMITVQADGTAEVVTGTSPHGQGHATSWAQLTADTLGIPFEDVVVRHGDTAVAARGADTYGSRSLVVGGNAVVDACEAVVEVARARAAELLEAAVDDVEFDAGTFAVRGSPEASVTIQAVAGAVADDPPADDGTPPSLAAEAVFETTGLSYPHGCHLALVEVDTETGAVRLLDYVAVDDLGTVVNPQIVEGQVHGGIAQGVAQALLEEVAYDDLGNPVTGTLVDYYVPTAADLMSFRTDRTETPSTNNPLGAKGVGEVGAIAAPPAVVNAVVDALRPLGVTDVPMPCSPQTVWRAIAEAAS